MQRSVRENIALPFTARIRRWGPIDLGAERKQVDRAIEHAPDRHARRGRGAPAVGRQPAEGDDRPLGRRRRADDAVLRPDPRHRHPHEAPDLRAAARPGRGRAPRSCSTPRSSRRSSSPATARSSSSAVGSSPRSPPPTPTSRRCCGRPTTSGRTRRCPRRSRPRSSPPRRRRRATEHRRPRVATQPTRRAAERPMTAATRSRSTTSRAPTGRRASPTGARATRWTLGLLGFFVLLLVFTRMIQPTYGVTGDPGPGDLGAAARPGRGRPGDRASSRAGSTSRSAR